MKITITIEFDEKELNGIEIEEECGYDGDDRMDGLSKYARFFDKSCKTWNESPRVNLYFLKSAQCYANSLLVHKGYLLLNEVYDMLGVKQSKDSDKVGWVYDEKNPVGDNYVDFGIICERNHEFVNELCNTAVLDFNVDGNILEYIK